MAREVTYRIVSDLSGEPVPDGEAVVVTIAFADRDRGKVKLDAAEGEVADLIARAQPAGRRVTRSRRRSAKE